MKSWILAVLAVCVVGLSALGAEGDKKKIVFVAGPPSHGWGQHEHLAGCKILAKALNESGLPVTAVVFENGWPKDSAKAFEGASAIIMYSDGGNGHMAIPHLKELDELNAKGVGIGAIHYAVEPGDEKAKVSGRAEFLNYLGGYYETFLSVNPHWRGVFENLPKHPVTSGVKPFFTNDEWYYHMRFRENMEGVTPILSAVPPDSTRKGKDDAHGGNPTVRDGIGKNLSETVVWVSENKNGSRGFGCTGGHNHINWWKDDFRKVILNAIVWTAKVDVPANGVPSKRPEAEEYLKQDEKVPASFNIEDFKKQVEEMNKPLEGK